METSLIFKVTHACNLLCQSLALKPECQALCWRSQSPTSLILFPHLFAVLCSCPSNNVGPEQAHHRIREGQATSKAFTDQILASGTNGSVRQDHFPSSSRPAFYH